MTVREIEKGFQEIRDIFKETDERLDKRFKETDERFRETDERLDKMFKETGKIVKETSKKVDALTSKWGRFVEGLIAPAVERLFKGWGIEVDKVHQRTEAHRNGKEMEVDLLGINGEYAVLIEAKSTLKIEHVDEHIERLEKFKLFFPEYGDRKVVGAVAGIVIEEDSDRYAYKKGMFVISQSGDTVRILNDDKFKPKVW